MLSVPGSLLNSIKSRLKAMKTENKITYKGNVQQSRLNFSGKGTTNLSTISPNFTISRQGYHTKKHMQVYVQLLSTTFCKGSICKSSIGNPKRTRISVHSAAIAVDATSWSRPWTTEGRNYLSPLHKMYSQVASS